jgi:osmotically inducible protein OsmC
MTSTIVQEAEVVWRGELMEGVGAFRSGTLEGSYSFPARFEGGPGTTPEELLAAAQATSFSITLARFLRHRGLVAEVIRTSATVHLHRTRPGGTQAFLGRTVYTRTMKAWSSFM